MRRRPDPDAHIYHHGHADRHADAAANRRLVRRRPPMSIGTLCGQRLLRVVIMSDRPALRHHRLSRHVRADRRASGGQCSKDTDCTSGNCAGGQCGRGQDRDADGNADAEGPRSSVQHLGPVPRRLLSAARTNASAARRNRVRQASRARFPIRRVTARIKPTPTSTPTPLPTAVPTGGPCTSPDVCDTGFCTNNVCCDSDTCLDPDRCDIFGTEGTCAPPLLEGDPCLKNTDCEDPLICAFDPMQQPASCAPRRRSRRRRSSRSPRCPRRCRTDHQHEPQWRLLDWRWSRRLTGLGALRAAVRPLATTPTLAARARPYSRAQAGTSNDAQAARHSAI